MGKKIDMKKSKTIEKIISDHLLVMTNESAQSTERGRDSGDYTEFNKYAMETLFLILRRLLVRDCLVENNEYDDTVILSGRGFIALGRETADFFNKKEDYLHLTTDKTMIHYNKYVVYMMKKRFCTLLQRKI